MRTFFAHLAWLLATLPEGLRFFLYWPLWQSIQRRKLSAARSQAALFIGRAPDENAPTDYGDYSDHIDQCRRGASWPVGGDAPLFLQPTSGTTMGSKLIPITPRVLKEYRAAVQPWLMALYLRYPQLLCGRHYWSISPNTRSDDSAGSIPLGSTDDTQFLTPLQRRVARNVMAVPPEVAAIHDGAAFRFVTMLFLLAAPDLRLISVWSPTYLLSLLQFLEERSRDLVLALEHGTLPDDLAIDESQRLVFSAAIAPSVSRAAEVRRILSVSGWKAGQLWPHLKVLSCWTDASAAGYLSLVERHFPRVAIQGKGLMATEGPVSIPIGNRRYLAYRSQAVEFLDEGSGSIVPWSDLRKGGRYEVLLSGGAGFWRYRLGDRVEILSEPPALPSLRFLGRSGLVSDIVGEKLDEAFASEVIASLRQRFAGLRPFCALAPGKERYLLIATTDGETDLAELAAECDRLLRANYHYAHARNIGQLKPVASVQSSAEVEALYLEWSGGAGRVLGEVKLPALWINSQLMTQLENL